MQDTDEIEFTKKVMIYSPRWQALANQYDVMEIANRGTLPFEEWTLEQHVEVRCWSCGQLVGIPEVIEKYFQGMKRKDFN